jgi:hypothetical protein
MSLFARVQALETLIQQAVQLARRAVAATGALVGVTNIQSGTVDLAGGTFTVVTATVTANTRIVATFKTSAGGDGAAPPFTTRLEVTARVPGAPGSFEIAALTNNGVLDATNISSVDWIAIN